MRPGACEQGSGETGRQGEAVAEKPGYPSAGEGRLAENFSSWTETLTREADSELRGHVWRYVSRGSSFSRGS